MCGIIFLLQTSSSLKLDPERLISPYKRNNSKTALATESTFKFLPPPPIDHKMLFQRMQERGPDSMSAQTVIFNSSLKKIIEKRSQAVTSEKILEIILSEKNNLESENCRLVLVSSTLKLRLKNGSSKNTPIQPLESENLIIAYNGELYGVDFRRLKEFESSFGDSSQISPNLLKAISLLKNYKRDCHDTSFLLKLLELTRDENYKKIICCLRGEYNILIFDKTKFEIIILRDQIGKRSLLFSKIENGILISSILPFKIADLPNASPSPKRYEGVDPEERLRRTIERKYYSSYKKIKEKVCFDLAGNSILGIKFNDDNIEKDVENQVLVSLNILDEEFDKYCMSFSLNNDKKINLGEMEQKIGNKNEQLPNIQEVILESEVKLLNNQKMISSPKKIEAKNIIKEKLFEIIKDMLFNIIGLFENFADPLLPLTEKSKLNFTNSKAAVLFSGGLDSSLIAHIILTQLPEKESLDLLNISFKENCSDRTCAIEAYEELKNLHPNRKINLILIDKEYSSVLKQEVSLYSKIYPSSSHLDFNIGAVLFWASKGEGILFETNCTIATSSRVVFSGLGADELFCGYRRYRQSYERDGFEEMSREMRFGKVVLKRFGKALV